ncbi:MAG: anthranilate synthase component I [Maricaulaceae bacterium]|nr:anthranilate synthase component I [Maricaulaceae bacterium]
MVTRLVRARRADDVNTPVAAYLKLAAGRAGAFLLESVEGGAFRGRYSAIGLDPDYLWTVRDGKPYEAEGAEAVATRALTPCGDDPVAALRAAIEKARLDLPADAPPMAAGLFGYLGYDMIRAVERLPGNAPDPLGTPEALLLRPRLVLVFDALKQEIEAFATVRPEDGADGEAAAQTRIEAAFAALDALAPAMPGDEAAPDSGDSASNTAPKTFRAMVAKAKDYIRAGDVFQAVLSQRFSRPFSGPPFSLYRALRRLNPSPFLFFFDFGDFAIAGSSPEILVRLRDGTVTVRPIAGTRPRGETPEEDTALEADLLADPKERAEHLMLLDLGRNDAGRVCAPGTVKVTEREIVERYSHVMHIVSNVEGRLAAGEDAVSALFAGFPAGTVSGAPKIRAMQIIDELEPHRRGVYAGAAGYFSAGGGMDMCIALRTAVVKDGVMHVQAGAGVVLESDPETERQETLNKARALFRAADEAGRFV